MPAWFALLRFLLCACLILDGTDAAVAATQMQLAHVAHVQMGGAKSVMHDAASPCHEHASMPAMSHPTAPAAMTDHAMAGRSMARDNQAPQSNHRVPDCCKSGHCSCACTLQVPAVMAWFAMPDAVIAHADAMGAMTTAHPSPALSHSIRPPIG